MMNIENTATECTLKIKNRSSKIIKTNILNPLNWDCTNFNMPSEIKVLAFTGPSDKLKKLEYQNLLKVFHLKNFVCQFLSATNTRQLIFYVQFPFHSEPVEPQLTIDKKPRKRIRKSGKALLWPGSFEDNWDPKVWNVCDTQEQVIYTGMNFIQILLQPREHFILRFKVLPESKLFSEIIQERFSKTNNDEK